MKNYTSIYGETVQAVRFTGSSTSKAAIREWMTSSIYRDPGVETRDWVTFRIDTWSGEVVVRPGDYVIRRASGFASLPEENFTRLFTEDTDE
jgi:hypothetical protein